MNLDRLGIPGGGDGIAVVPAPEGAPAGAWIVVQDDRTRVEIPIRLPTLDRRAVVDEIAETLHGLDADELWNEALAGCDVMQSPAELLLGLILERLDLGLD